MTFELEGQYVRLRPLQPADAEITLAWRLSNRAKLLNLGATDVVKQAEWIASRPAHELNFVIEIGRGTPVGMLSLVDINQEHRRAEPARFLIGEEDLTRGVPAAVEAMLLLYGLAFDQLGLVRLYGTVVSSNRLMLGWQKYFGMREEGRMRQHLYLNGSFHDAVIVGLLENEYRTVALPRMKRLIHLQDSSRSE